MTPIESEYDYRLVLIIGCLIDAVEQLALDNDESPDFIILNSLFKQAKSCLFKQDNSDLVKVFAHYPVLLNILEGK